VTTELAFKPCEDGFRAVTDTPPAPRLRCYCCDRERSAATAFCRPCQKSRDHLLGKKRRQLLESKRRLELSLARIESVLNPIGEAVSPA